MQTADTGPGIRFPPPAIFFLFVWGGFALQNVWHLRIVPVGFAEGARVAGSVAMAAGAGFIASAFVAFRRVRTTPIPIRPATALALGGPFRFSRNPMYVGTGVLCAGVALWLNALVAFLSVLPALLVIRYAVIAKEEHYLAAKFGEAYREYCSRVRRWL